MELKYYRLIKSNINEGWINALKSALNPGNIIDNTSSKLKQALKFGQGEATKISLKQIQDILKNRTFKPRYQIKWESLFNISINWKYQWKYSLEIPLSNKEKQLHWILLNINLV